MKHLRQIVSYLRKENFTVIEAADGEEALARFAEDEYCLVVLDLMLPKLNGFEVCSIAANQRCLF